MRREERGEEKGERERERKGERFFGDVISARGKEREKKKQRREKKRKEQQHPEANKSTSVSRFFLAFRLRFIGEGKRET